MNRLKEELFHLLEEKAHLYNNPNFIENDPITVPHSYKKLQDIEISGFFAATLAWGQRKTIINKCKELMSLMDNSPFDFIINHSERDLKALTSFKHRTFNPTDLLYFIHFFKHIYSTHQSLEEIFSQKLTSQSTNIEKGINHFHDLFVSLESFPERTGKHVASPAKKSACKRINMFLRWMVRTDDKGVDFGLWNNIKPSQLVCPCDIHVERTARKLKLISRKQLDWTTAVQLTEALKLFDPLDPVKYDFALFGMGLEDRSWI